MAEINKLIEILNQRAAAGPGDGLSKTDSLNVALGMTHAFKNALKGKIDAMSKEDRQQELANMAEDGYQGMDAQHMSAMELHNAMLEAKKAGKGLGDLKMSEGARQMFESLIQPKTNQAIAGGAHEKFMSLGQGINPLDIRK